jgi:serine/threonine protein phosphatase PrpC
VSRLEVQPGDKFVVIGSDGLFDFFTNEEVVEYVDKFLMAHPTGDPAKYMVEQLLVRAAHTAGMR